MIDEYGALLEQLLEETEAPVLRKIQFSNTLSTTNPTDLGTEPRYLHLLSTD
jgi:hypothetical protein